MSKTDEQSKAAAPRTGPKPVGAPQRRSAEAVERVEAPKRPARAVGVQLADEVARLERELATARAQLAELTVFAQIDPLTDILNRRGLERELKRSLAHVKRYGASAALVYLDLDGFKRVNDRHGHAAGDAVLKAVAMVLDRHIRESDVVARVGGDEFCVFGAELNLNPEALLARLDYNIARFNAEHSELAPLSASAGIWRCPFGREEPLDSIVAQADQAMYERKRARRKNGS